VTIFYKNNGKPFPDGFDFKDYTAVDKASGHNAGTGLGGKLIAKAMERCGGLINPIELHGKTATEWNVIIQFILKRNNL